MYTRPNNFNSRSGKLQIHTLREERPGFLGFIESVFYELKPLLYSGLAFFALTHNFADAWYVRFACLAVLIFSFLVVFSRLAFRGYISNG